MEKLEPTFYVNKVRRSLMVEANGERDILIVAAFRLRENKYKALAFLEGVATQLNELYETGHEAEAEEVFTAAEGAIQHAQMLEACLEEINF